MIKGRLVECHTTVQVCWGSVSGGSGRVERGGGCLVRGDGAGGEVRGGVNWW